MLKLEDNPPILSPWMQSIESATGRWWVAHVKSNSEKAAAWHLADRRVECFLPMTPRTIFSGGRKRHGMKPLFPSYVFFSGGDDARLSVISCRHVCQILSVPDQIKLMRELSAIERCLNAGSSLDLFPSLAQGDTCRVTGGPLVGLQGTLVRCDNQARLVLHVSLLGQGASLEIDANLLEKVEAERANGPLPRRFTSPGPMQLSV